MRSIHPSARSIITSRPILSPMRPSSSRPRFTPTLSPLAMWQAPYDDYPGLILDPGRPDSIFDRVCLWFVVHLEGVDVDGIDEDTPSIPSLPTLHVGCRSAAYPASACKAREW